jgi:hypothetical protein
VLNGDYFQSGFIVLCKDQAGMKESEEGRGRRMPRRNSKWVEPTYWEGIIDNFSFLLQQLFQSAAAAGCGGNVAAPERAGSGADGGGSAAGQGPRCGHAGVERCEAGSSCHQTVDGERVPCKFHLLRCHKIADFPAALEQKRRNACVDNSVLFIMDGEFIVILLNFGQRKGDVPTIFYREPKSSTMNEKRTRAIV